MVSAEKSIAIRAPIGRVYDVITDFESYPEFQSEIETAKVLRKSARSVTVAFVMNLMQRVDYTLKFALEKPGGVTWKFVEGDSMLKDNSGSWTLSSLEPDLTDVTYRINIDFSVWLPSSIVESLLNDHLPKMLAKFKERAEA